MNIKNDKNKLSRFVPLLAFGSALLIYTVVLALLKIAPFGERTIITGDLYGQYSCFLADLKSVFSGDGLFYSFEKSLGGNYYSLAAYYLFSPLNFIMLLFPLRMLPTAISVLIVLKLSLCALTAGIYFNHLSTKGRNSTNCIITLILSIAWSMVGYGTQYSINVMWLDALIMLPLILIGLERLVDGKSPLVYILSLGSAIIFNYYIGYILCAFCLLYFLYLMLRDSRTVREWGAAIIRFAISSLLAGGLSGVAIIPAVKALSGSKADFPGLLSADFVNLYLLILTGIAALVFFWTAVNAAKQNKHIPAAIFAVLGSGSAAANALLFISASRKFELYKLPSKLLVGSTNANDLPNGLPNIYCGVLIMLLLVMYYIDKRIPVRRRALHGLLLAGLVSSCIIDKLDLFWHCLNYPNWFFYRYSFVISFVMLIAAYELLSIGELNGKRTIAVGCIILIPIASLLSSESIFNGGHFTKQLIIVNIALIMVYTALLFANTLGRKWISKISLCSLAAIFCFELGMNTYTTINSLSGWYGSDGYVSNYEAFLDKTLPALGIAESQDDDFYRIEKTYSRTLNDGLLLGYNGVSHYSSTMNVSDIGFLRVLGFPYYFAWTSYGKGSSAAADSLLGVRYLLSESDVDKPYTLVSGGDVKVYENPYALGLAIPVSRDILDCAVTMDPIENLNMIYSSLLGESANLYEPVEYDIQFIDGYFVLNFTAKSDEQIFFFAGTDVYGHDGELIVNGISHGNCFDVYNYGLIPIGRFEVGERVEMIIRSTIGEALADSFELCYEHTDVLARAHDKLTGWTHAEADGSRVEVSFKGGELGSDAELIMLTLPYDENFRAYADGKQVDVIKALHFIAVELPKGTKTLELRYRPAGFTAGVVISLVSAALTAVYVYFNKKRRNAI
ncbi:MAG: YfhO family protein [Clostridiales bacterium]|nr:YfhO family protein [Clostridiales bacterium]